MMARQVQVPVNRITGILNGQRGVTGDTALRLGRFFGTSGEFWLNLQKLYELRLAETARGEESLSCQCSMPLVGKMIEPQHSQRWSRL